MMVEEYLERVGPVWEVEEHLRVIRDAMDRSTRYSTFSGLSGVLAGIIAILGCLVQQFFVHPLPLFVRPAVFIANWSITLLLAALTDYLLTKRPAARVGKRILSRLGRQILEASAPALGAGLLLTLYFIHRGMMDELYPFWMLDYGAAICAVGLFSQKAVSRLGWAFVAAGAFTLALQSLGLVPIPGFGLMMMAVSAGGFHIVYGITVARCEGW